MSRAEEPGDVTEHRDVPAAAETGPATEAETATGAETATDTHAVAGLPVDDAAEPAKPADEAGPEPADDADPEPPTSAPAAGPVRRSRRATARIVAVRATTGLAVLAVTGLVVTGGSLLPPAEPGVVGWDEVAVPPSATDLVCPGPVRLATEPEPGSDVAYDPQFDPSPGEAVSALRALTVGPPAEGSHAERPATATLTPLGGDRAGEETVQPSGEAAVSDVPAAESSVVVHADPAGDSPSWAAAAMSTRTLEGDLRGVVAASCQLPTTESWLVGGSTSLGSSARLVLQNPGRTAATVEVELWGPAGQVELAGAPEYLVPPQSERVVLLEGVAAEQRRIVVRASASGGQVTAYLQDSELRGLVPAGVDYVVGSQAPDTRQVVPGLSVTATEVDGADTAVLRLLAPGADGGRATISLLGLRGEVALPGTDDIALEPGTVLDVPLGGLPAGTYTAVVDADVPVVAGAMLTRGLAVGLPDAGTLSTASLERAWAPSVAVGASGPLALPEGNGGALVLAAVRQRGVSGTADVVVEVIGTDGAVLGERSLELTAGTTTALSFAALLPAEGDAEPVDTSDAAGVVVRSDDPRVAWTGLILLSSKAGDLVSVLSPVPPRVAQPEVGVRVR